MASDDYIEDDVVEVNGKKRWKFANRADWVMARSGFWIGTGSVQIEFRLSA
ncbi:hypothetical protein Hanom_Chr12g01067701 [Helianthus anomalus]